MDSAIGGAPSSPGDAQAGAVCAAGSGPTGRHTPLPRGDAGRSHVAAVRMGGGGGVSIKSSRSGQGARHASDAGRVGIATRAVLAAGPSIHWPLSPSPAGGGRATAGAAAQHCGLPWGRRGIEATFLRPHMYRPAGHNTYQTVVGRIRVPQLGKIVWRPPPLSARIGQCQRHQSVGTTQK